MTLSLRNRRRGRADAEALIAARGGEVPEPGGVCGAPTRKHNQEAGHSNPACSNPAGMGTAHLGYGTCMQHGGNWPREAAKWSWVMGHQLARALNVTPWEALLGEVRRTAGAVAWLDRKVAEAPSDESLLRGGADPETGEPGYAGWVKLRLTERQHLARVSKLAVDAGVARELVAQFTLQGEVVARMLTNMVQGLASRGLGLSAEQESLLDDLLGRELLALEATSSEERVMEGEVVEIGRNRRTE